MTDEQATNNVGRVGVADGDPVLSGWEGRVGEEDAATLVLRLCQPRCWLKPQASRDHQAFDRL